jgi:hypothetical protein
MGDRATDLAAGEREVPALIRTRRLFFTSGLVAVTLAMSGPAYAEKGFGGTDGET